MQDTRLQILSILQTEQRASAETLAKKMGFAIATIRHHMNILERDGLIQREVEHQSIGRPRLLYSISPRGQESFPKRYDQLSSYLISALKDRSAPEAIKNLLSSIAHGIVEENSPDIERKSLNQRTACLCQLLAKEGHVPRLSEDREHLSITLLTCPYLAVATRHTEICILDIELIHRILPGPVERKAWRPDGDHVCTFSVNKESL